MDTCILPENAFTISCQMPLPIDTAVTHCEYQKNTGVFITMDSENKIEIA